VANMTKAQQRQQRRQLKRQAKQQQRTAKEQRLAETRPVANPQPKPNPAPLSAKTEGQLSLIQAINCPLVNPWATYRVIRTKRCSHGWYL
jgi:hypothetical protein